MGVIHRAHDRLADRPVALKLLLEADDALAARFAREAELLSDLQHEGIVRYVAHGIFEGHPWLAMEWLEGEDLEARLRHDGLDPSESVDLAIRVADALGTAHARGIVHRDLKPSNLFLADGDPRRVKLLDFGIARRTLALGNTAVGSVLGTPGYMAPEQARGESSIDARADVFALGCVLFETLVGRPAFSGGHPMAILAKILLEDVPRISSVRSWIPRELDDLVHRMMAKERDARPHDGRAVATLLRAIGPLAEGPRTHSTVAPTSLGSGEQRIVSVLLARSNVTTETREAESLARTVSAHEEGHSMIRAVEPLLARFEAKAEVLLDGSMIASLHGHGSATDRAARAASFARALRSVLPDATIVLSTGRGLFADRTPIGEVIDRAVALSNVERGEPTRTDAVRIDDVTAGLLDERYDVRKDAHGFALLGIRDRIEPGRTLLGKETPFVGRDRELAFLANTFDESANEAVARVMIVTAASGEGKSRLRNELVRTLRTRAPGVEILVGSGDAMRAGSPYRLLSRALRSSSGMLDDEPREVQRTKLGKRISKHVRAPDVPRVTAFLAELVGVPFGDEEHEARPQLLAARSDAMLMGDQIRRAWEDFVAAESEHEPLVLVLDDIQWGDFSSFQLVDAALRNLHDRPLVVFAFGRPEIHDSFPRLWAERDRQEVRLGPLSRRAAEKLARAVLGDIDGERVARIVSRAAGNALYLEELIRADAAGSNDAAPETVLAMVEARLLSLAPEARRVLRAASVFGATSWLSGIVTLLGDDAGASDVRRSVQSLVESELLVQRDASRFSDETELAFRHELVREAAYAMLTPEDRALGHRLAGEWLEARGAHDPLFLAQHFERAGSKDRAARHYARAAEDALSGNDLAAAIARANQAIECGLEGEERGSMILVRAEAHRWRGEVASAGTAASEAFGLLARGGAKWCTAAGEWALALGQAGDADGLDRLARDVLAREPEPNAIAAYVIAIARASLHCIFLGRQECARAISDRIDALEPLLVPKTHGIAIGRVHQLRAHQTRLRDDISQSLRLHERGLRLYEEAGDIRAMTAQRSNLADTLKEIGAYARAEEILQMVRADAERLGLDRVTAHALQDLGYVLAFQGRTEEGADLERQALSMAITQGAQRLQMFVHVYFSRVLFLKGDYEGADREAAIAYGATGLANGFRAFAAAARAQSLLATGRAPEALALMREAMPEVDEPIEEGESLIDLVVAEAHRANGLTKEANRAIESARARVLERAAGLDDEELRRAFLENVPENVRILALANEWVGPLATSPAPPRG